MTQEEFLKICCKFADTVTGIPWVIGYQNNPRPNLEHGAIYLISSQVDFRTAQVERISDTQETIYRSVLYTVQFTAFRKWAFETIEKLITCIYASDVYHEYFDSNCIAYVSNSGIRGFGNTITDCNFEPRANIDITFRVLIEKTTDYTCIESGEVDSHFCNS